MSTLAVWCRVVRSRDVSAHIGGCNWVFLRRLAYFGHAAWLQQSEDHHKVPQVRWSRVTISRLETQAWSTADNWLGMGHEADFRPVLNNGLHTAFLHTPLDGHNSREIVSKPTRSRGQ